MLPAAPLLALSRLPPFFAHAHYRLLLHCLVRSSVSCCFGLFYEQKSSHDNLAVPVIMEPQTILDFVVFQLTPTRTRCELYAAAGEETEKLASGILKPFCLHLRSVKEQLAKGGHSIRLRPPVHATQQSFWFTKGTLQRFIRFVSNPDVLERVITIEVELKQLEETAKMQTRNFSKTHAQHLQKMNLLGSLSPRGVRRTVPGSSRKIFQKNEDSHGVDGNSILGNSRRRLLHALEARRTILQKEQGMSFARATAAGFDDVHVKELILFSDCFGATRLREACLQFIDLYTRRQVSSICGESMSTTTCNQSDSSLITGGEPQILCKLHISDSNGGSRVLEQSCEEPHDAEWPCNHDKENEIYSCCPVQLQGNPSNLSTANDDCVPQNSCICNQEAKVCTCNSWQNARSIVVRERCLLAGDDYKEREGPSITISESPCTSRWCNCCCCCCCCRNPLRDTKEDHKVSTPVCMTPSKDTNDCQCLSESEFPSSNLSSQSMGGEPLHELVSNPSRYDPTCTKLHGFTIQVNNSFDHECLLSHCLNHNGPRKKRAVHECCLENEECSDQTPQQSIYDQESASNLIVINNQIFSASHSTVKKNEEIEETRKCCKEQRCGDEFKPFSLCVRDMVSIFERRSHEDELLPLDVCKIQESTNYQNARTNIFEKWSADSSLIGEGCQKSYRHLKVDGRETLIEGDFCSSKMPPSESQQRQGVGLHDLKPSKVDDKEAGSWNPLYQDCTPSNTSFWTECTTKKLSGSSSAKEITCELSSHRGVFATDSCIQVPQTSRPAALPQQLISSVSRPSEERVKRFLDRYYEKREEKLRNRFYVEKVKAGQLFVDQEHGGEASNLAPEKSVKSSRRNLQVGKPGKSETYKVNTPKSVKNKNEEGQRRLEGLHACQQDRISTSTTGGDSMTGKSPQTVNSRLSSAKLPAPRKASGMGLVTLKQKKAAGSLPGCRNVGASKRVGNPLSSSAPSFNKIESRTVGPSSTQGSTASLSAVDKKKIGETKTSPHSKSMTATGPADKQMRAVRKPSTKEVTPHAASARVKDQVKSFRKNATGKGTLLSITNEGMKAGPKNFLRKGAGSSRLRARSGVIQPKSVANKEADTIYEGVSSIASPPSVSQTGSLALGKQSQEDPPESLLAEEDDAKRGSPFTEIPTAQLSSASITKSIDEYEQAERQESGKLLKRKGLQISTRLPEEPSPLLLSSNTQPNHCVDVYGCNQSGENYAGAACLDYNSWLTPFSLAEPFNDSLQNNVISIRCDPFEIPAAQDRIFGGAPYLPHNFSAHHFGSGLLDVERSTANFQQSRTKGGARRIMPLLEQHVPTNNQGIDLKRFLKFGWRNTNSTAGSDQASASVFSEEDEDSGSFSEPMPKVLDCYGRKRHAAGKTLNSRVSVLDAQRYSPTNREHDEFKGHKTIMHLKRSLSTHEVHSKSRDQNVSKSSAVKATRAFFSLAPFRRKSVEAK